MDVVRLFLVPETLSPLFLTLQVLGISGILLLVLGVLLGAYLSGKPSLGRSVADFLTVMPLVFPPIATGFLLLMVLGRNSPVGRMLPLDIVFAFPGLVLAAVLAGLPLVAKPVEAALRTQGHKLAEVASVLGKTQWQTLVLVLLPAIRRPLLAGWLLALGRSMGEVGITLMLGGNITGKTNTLSLEIYNCVFTGEFDRAMVLCILIGSLSCGLLLILKRLSAL